jgi:hypothetical protein
MIPASKGSSDVPDSTNSFDYSKEYVHQDGLITKAKQSDKAEACALIHLGFLF